MLINKPRDIGKVVKNLYETQGLKRELVAEFLNLDVDELDSFENGYHVVNAFDLERLCALFRCDLCPTGIDMTNYSAIETKKPLNELKVNDLDSVVSRHLKDSRLLYSPQSLS